MPMTFEYWFMFPIAILVATTAMASGVGGATFFAPIFILALRLPPEVAIGTGLITEVFGFASGVGAYVRKRLIDYRLGGALLLATIPLAIVGSWLAGVVSSSFLKIILGMGLLAVALSFLRTPEAKDVGRADKAIDEEYGGEEAETRLVTAGGEEIRYTVCNRTEGRIIAGVGALFVGLISTGLGELNGYFLLRRCKVPSKVSVATSVFVVAFTALAAATGHLVQFIRTGGDALQTVLSIVIFTVPGVLVGAQLGAAVASRISQHALERALGGVFVLIAVLTLWEALL
jgi:uncharacterized membrane protein YfcA